MIRFSKAGFLTCVVSILALSAASASAAQIDVTPGNLDGWVFSNADNSGTNASGGFVAGPSTAPLGAGSAQFVVGDSGSSEILIQGLAGPTTLGSLTALAYSTYVTTSTPGSGSAPTLQFDLFKVINSTQTYQGRLVFDPGLLGTVVDGTWQSWDASTADAWYFSRSLNPGSCSIAGQYCTFAQASAFLDANGFFTTDNLFKAGSGQASFQGNVDAYTVNGTTYNFDPVRTSVPEPVTFSLFGAGLLGAGALRRRKSKKTAAV